MPQQPTGRRFTPRTRKLSKRDANTVKRLMQYFKKYKVRFTLVLICIIIGALASVSGSMFVEVVIDQYIEPLLLTPNPSLDGLTGAIKTMA